jgi:hypothetical protein
VADIDPATVPGFREAVAAVATEWPWLDDELHPRGVAHLVALVMGVTRPHVQAELLADMSDDLALLAGGIDTADTFILDHTSHEIREHLNGR